MKMTNFNYDDLLKNGKIFIDCVSNFQSASKDLFQASDKWEIYGLGEFIIKKKMNEDGNKVDFQFFIKLENPENYKSEKFRVKYKNKDKNEVKTSDIDFFNGDSIMSDVIHDWDITNSLYIEHLSRLT